MGRRQDDTLFQATPCAIVVPALPARIDSISGRRSSHLSYLIREFTQSTNFETADRNWSEIIEHHLRRFHDGEVNSIYRLLDINIEFIRDARVRKAIFEAELTRRRRGRPKGRSEKSQTLGSILVLLVDAQLADPQLVATRIRPSRPWRTVEECKSRDRTFDALAQEGFEGLDYDRIKQLYYQFRNDTRLAPYLVRFDELTQVVRGGDLRLDEARAQAGQEEVFRGPDYELCFRADVDRDQ